MSITTKTGDQGQTSLLFGHRVSKTDPRIETCGAVDELNARLGMVRACSQEEFLTQPILQIQLELVILMGEMVVLKEDRDRYFEKGFKAITDEMADRLTRSIEDLENRSDLSYEKWATPGENQLSAALELARTGCRTAERRCLAVRETGAFVSDTILVYLNRLSDLLWLWARWAERN